jgi:hypothetical protein
MKIYKTYNELRDAPYPVYSHCRYILLGPKGSYVEVLEQVVKMGLKEKDVFEWALGGFVYVLEEVKDLDQIETHTPDVDEKRWLTLKETADVFDAMDLLEGDWLCVLNITNNSGGPMYYIPGWMRLHCSYIQKSYELTNAIPKNQEF